MSAGTKQNVSPERTFHLPIFQGQTAVHPENHPPLARQHVPVSVPPGNCHHQPAATIYHFIFVLQETGASVDQIFFWYEKCRQFFGPALDDDDDDVK